MATCQATRTTVEYSEAEPQPKTMFTIQPHNIATDKHGENTEFPGEEPQHPKPTACRRGRRCLLSRVTQ